MDELRFVDACTEEHFKAMSLIHALGWRDIPTRLRRAGTPLDFLCSGEMNSPCAKSLPWARATRRGVPATPGRGGDAMQDLTFVDACTEEHFKAMSLIHALGWRDTYAKAVPADYMAREITDDRWVEVFRQNYESQNGVHGLLLYRGDVPVSCLNYCKARMVNYNPGDFCEFDNGAYADWGEIASFYTHPAERGKGYGGLLFEEACRRMKEAGFRNAFVFVLQENRGARRFYAGHGFAWDGTSADIPFPNSPPCHDLRYVKAL